MKKQARKYVVKGRVQGVGFRFFTENHADGTVEAYAVGDAASLEEFKAALAAGPRTSRVDQVQEFEEQVNKSCSRFVIESDW